MSRLRSQLITFIAVMGVALPLAADLTGITTTPINLPAKGYAAIAGPDGNLWILTDKGNLGKLTPAGIYAEYPLQFGQSVFSLTSGIDGNLWIAGNNGHVERVTTSGVVTDFAVAPSFYFPDPIVTGSDGATWFYANENPAPGASNTWKLGRIDIYGQFKTYDLGISDLRPSGDFLRGLVSGGDGNLWFIDETKNQVVKFSMVTKSIAGTFPIPSPSSGSDDQMTLGWDGNVWFTRGTSIDRVTPDGAITEFHVPSGGKAAAILMSADGNIWFTEPSSGKLGQLVMSSITGGTATINETAFAPDVQGIFLNLPPAFASLPVGPNALHVAPDAQCPPVVRVLFDSFGRPYFVVTPPPPECVPVSLSEVHPHSAESTSVSQLEFAAIFIGSPATAPLGGSAGNVQPLDVRPFAQPATLTAVLNLAAAPGVTITNVSASDPSAIVSFSGLTATIKSSTSVTANVSISSPSGIIAGAVVVSSNLPDPDPRDHVASFYLDTSSARRAVLPSNPPNTVITPVARGK